MKKTAIVLSMAVILIALVFAGCKGADGGKITNADDPIPIPSASFTKAFICCCNSFFLCSIKIVLEDTKFPLPFTL